MSIILMLLPASRTLMVTLSCGGMILLLVFLDNRISFQGDVCHQALFILIDAHEIRETGNVEYLSVMLAQPVDGQRTMCCAGTGQQPDDQRDPGAIDVIYVAKIEDDHCRVLCLGLLISGSEGRFNSSVDLTVQINDDGVFEMEHRCS